VLTALGLGAWGWTERIAPQRARQPTGPALRQAVTAPHVLVYWPGEQAEFECHCPHRLRFEDLSPAFVKVLVGTEDRSFWRHGGVDWRAIGRAALNNLTTGSRQGASTLAQQLVKLKLLGPEQTYERKILEALLAREVTALLSRKELLAAYANAAWFAPGVVGIEAAARHFFGKPARALTLWESAVLVGMLKAPSGLNPQVHPEASAERARTVLSAMVEAGLLAPAEMKRAVRAGPQPGRAQVQAGLDPRWYLDAVRVELKRIGHAPAPGTVVRVSIALDPAQQAAAQRLVARAAPSHLSAVVSAELDGRVRALVGGADYDARQWNLALHEKRQAASLAKIPVAAAALRNGLGPSSTVLDAPLAGSWPRNGARPHSFQRVTVSHAFAQSLNAPFARLVARDIEDGVARARGLILACLPGLEIPRLESIATGAFDVTPLEAAGLVAGFATGRCVTPRTILAVTGSRGELLYGAPAGPGARLVPARTAETLNEMLREAVEHGTGRRARISGVVVRGKTGTSEDNRHAWFVGFTQGGPLSVHWVGAGAGTARRSVSGELAAGQFRAFQAPFLLDPPRAKAPLPTPRPKNLRIPKSRWFQIVSLR